MPQASAPSVPGRTCRCRSACSATFVRRGSTTMSLRPRAFCARRFLKNPWGEAQAPFLPTIIVHFAFGFGPPEIS